MKDAKNFDTRAWIVAVGIVLSAFVILSLGICIVLYKEWQEAEEDLPGMQRQKAFVACLLLLDPFFLLPVTLLLLYFAVPLCFFFFTHQFTNKTRGGREKE